MVAVYTPFPHARRPNEVQAVSKWTNERTRSWPTPPSRASFLLFLFLGEPLCYDRSHEPGGKRSGFVDEGKKNWGSACAERKQERYLVLSSTPEPIPDRVQPMSFLYMFCSCSISRSLNDEVKLAEGGR